ncbi:MAG: ChaN family lipoprotein [Gemmatimonadaceae bacterium]|nr:ChaN family lipoprotein [Gemmatimonadaceae bacterium]MCW5826401.1 ChaN family lipoprotein [Gemmatimonadaceae bacterium]
MRAPAAALLLALSAAGAPAAAQAPLPAPAPQPPQAQPQPPRQYEPHRLYNTKTRRFGDLETLIKRIASEADVVYLGEFHNDPGTHVLQAAILEGVRRRRSDAIVLSLEMFERDVQPQLDSYLAGRISEDEFLGASRPWGNYLNDYRPMVEQAKANGWPVVGGNIPRRLAQVVSRRGLAALDSVPESDRPYFATEHICPRDEYWERFRETMGDMSGHGMQLTPDQVEAMVWRTYQAQCVKDEAMAESIVAARAAHNTLVIHANGAFHSDFGLGTAARVKRRDRRVRQLVVSFVPVQDLDAANGRAHRKRADYIVFTLAPAPAAPATP